MIVKIMAELWQEHLVSRNSSNSIQIEAFWTVQS